MKKFILIYLFATTTLFCSTAIAQVAPLLTTKWNQGCYYNADCPVKSGGPCGKAYTGCGATAAAQIIKYYQHPATGYGDTVTFNYSAMPNTLSSNNAQVAKLMYICGQKQEMNYSAIESTSYGLGNSLQKYFKYSIFQTPVSKSLKTNTEWENLIKNELNNGRVVSVKGGSHFYIVDGYNSSNKFHLNFGWGGAYDGYYDIHNVDLPIGNFTPYSAEIGISPLLNIEVTPSVTVASGSTSTSFQLASLKNWTASSDQSWCTPDLLSGTEGYYNSTATFPTNSSYSDRSATITYSDGTKTAKITITQKGIVPVINVNGYSLSPFSSGGSTQNTSLVTDSNWVATSNDAWLSCSPASGVGNTSISITAAANGPASRTGSIVFTRGSLTQTVSVFQEAETGTFWCTPSIGTSGTIGLSNVKLNTLNRTSVINEGYVNTGQGTTLKIDSTYSLSATFSGTNMTAPAIWIDWNIDGDFTDANEAITGAIWYPSSASTKVKSITVPSSAKEGLTRMRVYCKNFGTGPVASPCGTTDAGGDIEDYDINIIGEHYLNISPTALTYLQSGSSQNISISCDSAWSFNNSSGWLSFSSTNGNGDATITISALANTALAPRNEVITFTRGSISKTLSIFQNAADTLLTATPDSLHYINIGDDKSISVISNVPYTITSNQSWIIPDSSSGTGNKSINIKVIDNPANINRSGTVTLSSGTYVKIIYISQDATSNTLSLSDSVLNFDEFGTVQSSTLTTPNSWNASVSASWIQINQITGSGDFVFNISCDTNLVATPRNGSITITNGLITKVITVNQDAAIMTSIVESINNSEKWKIYPNPSTAVFHLQSNSGNTKNNDGVVYNLLGEVVTTFRYNEENNNIIDLSSFENGIYFVAFLNENDQQSYFKIVKE